MSEGRYQVWYGGRIVAAFDDFGRAVRYATNWCCSTADGCRYVKIIDATTGKHPNE